MEVISQEEFDAILAAITAEEFKTLLRFAWETGGHPQEVKNIKTVQVEIDQDESY